MATREIEGWFWFPPDPQRAFGTIAISPRDLRLKLRDSPRDEDTLRSMVVLHGESLQGQPLSVLGAFVTRYAHNSHGHNVEEFRFNELLVGAHVLDESELSFKRAVYHLRGLREWMSAGWYRANGYGSPYSFRQLVGPPPRSLRARWSSWRGRRRDGGDANALPHPLEVELPGAKLTFAYERSAGFGRFDDVTTYDAYVVVELDEELPLDAWRKQWSRPLVDLLVFATREQVVVERFDAVIYDNRLAAAMHPAIRRGLPDRVWARHEIEVVRPHQVEVRERGIEPFQHMLLPLAALRREAPTKLAHYFAVYRQLGATAPFFFVVLNTRTTLEENRLLNLMAFAEGYHRTFHDAPPLPPELHRELRTRMLDVIPRKHRRVYSNPLNYANQQSQRQRVGTLIAYAAAAVPSFADPGNVFRNKLVDTRNLYTHQAEPGEHAISDADELHNCVERFIQVLEINILVNLGLHGSEVAALHRSAHPAQ